MGFLYSTIPQGCFAFPMEQVTQDTRGRWHFSPRMDAHVYMFACMYRCTYMFIVCTCVCAQCIYVCMFYVCRCVRVHVCTHVHCLYICMYVPSCMCLCVCMCARVCMFVHACALFTDAFVCTGVCCLYTCTHVMFVHVHVYTCAYTCGCMFLNVSTYACMCSNMCVQFVHVSTLYMYCVGTCAYCMCEHCLYVCVHV